VKIAIFHNFLDNIGGAEIVGLTLARELKADVYTTNIDKTKINKLGFDDIAIHSIGKIPINAPFKQQLALWRFRKLNLKNKYDFYIIDGDWAISGAVNNKPNLWYVHSPIREIWDLYKFVRQNSVPWCFRYVFDLWVKYNRYLNKKYIKHVDHLVCNSKNTQKRVEKFLGRKAEVVYPPIDTKKYHYGKNGDFWLSVNRLMVHKRIDMQIEAFKKLPGEKLVIVGSYERSRHFIKYAKYIYTIKPDNVVIENWISDQELIRLYAGCKGFITTSLDEDFGMAPVEAMASGKPVIASNEGGYKETVIDQVTGRLIDDINEDKIVQAVSDVGRDIEKYRDPCIDRAKSFDTEIFIKKIKKLINIQF